MTELSPAATLLRSYLVKCGFNKGRCPTNDQIARLLMNGLPRSQSYHRSYSRALDELVEAGILRIEVYAKNWRVAVVKDEGGKVFRTQSSPWGGRHSVPYLIREGRGGVPTHDRGGALR